MIDLFYPPKPPEPKTVSFVRDEMRNESRDHRLSPEERYAKRLAQMREYSRQHASKQQNLREGVDES